MCRQPKKRQPVRKKNYLDQTKKPSPARMSATHPQPRGRPRKDCTWCTATGQWKPNGASPGAVMQGSRLQRSQPQWTAGPNPAFRPQIHVESEADRADRERRRIEEEEERRRVFEAESALLRAAEKARVEEEQRLAREKERLEAPRRYAASLGNCGSAHVYYFDTKGDFQELGKEGERTFPKREPLKKRVKITREEWVHGPNADLLLEEGESELATVTRWVWKCV